MMKIKRIQKLNNLEYTVDIEVENTHSYQLDNGWVSHNTVSQLVDSASGIHPRHSKYYIRSVRADKKDPLCQFMIDRGFVHESCQMRPGYTEVFYFPVCSPDGLFRTDISALEHLDLWRTYNKYWSEHNVSVTISVKENEWLDVAAYVYKHFDDITGISFLPFSDHSYSQAPYQECTKEEYEKLLAQIPQDIDWTELQKYETTDVTEGSQEFACIGGKCEL